MQDNVPKIVVSGSAGKGEITNVTINRLQMGGYSSVKHTNTSGLKITNLGTSDVVNIVHLDGDIHAIDNDGLILVGFHTAGQVGGLILCDKPPNSHRSQSITVDS